VSAAVRSSSKSVTIAVAPSEAPDLGDRAAAFHGSMGVAGGQVAADVDIVIVQQGRAVVLLLAIDTTGSLHGRRLTSLANTILMRLVPRFGT
jgi:hypothetical protein